MRVVGAQRHDWFQLLCGSVEPGERCERAAAGPRPQKTGRARWRRAGAIVRDALFLAGLALLSLGCEGTPQKSGEVVVYTSVDQVYSEPVLEEFARKTGIRVKPVFDVEASKTTGLVNRLIAEKDNPQCDVFWNGEVARTLILKKKGILAPYRSPLAEGIPKHLKDEEGYWTGFAARARVIAYNTNLLSEQEVPQSILDLADPKWRGRVAIAYPLFGTTATHVAALFAHLGDDRAREYLTRLKENRVAVVDGNSVVRDLVVEGRYPIGLTDTDDVTAAVKAGKPIQMVFPDQGGFGTLLIPNTVALIRGAPHPETGKMLIDYLVSEATEQALIRSGAAQVPVRPEEASQTPPIRSMPVSFEAVAEQIEKATRFCQALFVR